MDMDFRLDFWLDFVWVNHPPPLNTNGEVAIFAGDQGPGRVYISSKIMTRAQSEGPLCCMLSGSGSSARQAQRVKVLVQKYNQGPVGFLLGTRVPFPPLGGGRSCPLGPSAIAWRSCPGPFLTT